MTAATDSGTTDAAATPDDAVGAGPATDLQQVGTALYELILAADRFRAAQAHELGLSTTDVVALVEIARHPGIRPGDLARALGLGVAGTSSVIDKLVKAGFSRRERDPSDRRGLNLRATPAGQHAYGWLTDTLAAGLYDSTRGSATTPSELADNLRMLSTIRHAGSTTRRD